MLVVDFGERNFNQQVQAFCAPLSWSGRSRRESSSVTLHNEGELGKLTFFASCLWRWILVLIEKKEPERRNHDLMYEWARLVSDALCERDSRNNQRLTFAEKRKKEMKPNKKHRFKNINWNRAFNVRLGKRRKSHHSVNYKVFCFCFNYFSFSERIFKLKSHLCDFRFLPPFSARFALNPSWQIK